MKPLHTRLILIYFPTYFFKCSKNIFFLLPKCMLLIALTNLAKKKIKYKIAPSSHFLFTYNLRIQLIMTTLA